MTPTIRPAQTFDAEFAAPLIQEAIGAIGHHLTGTDNDADAAHVIAQFFPLRGHRLSFTNVLMAEGEGGQPLGLAVLYPGDLAAALDDIWRAHRRSLGLEGEITTEARPGELYLDTLATLPAARGQGIGAALLGACAGRAREQGLTLTLLVEDGNPARRLYERQGLREVGREELAGHHYARLSRQK